MKINKYALGGIIFGAMLIYVGIDIQIGSIDFGIAGIAASVLTIFGGIFFVILGMEGLRTSSSSS